MMPDFTQTGKSEDTTSTPKDNVPVVVFKNVSKQYGQISALTDISLAISGGVTGILGMNGAGKSTLFKIIMGKIRPSGGQIRLFGEDPWKNQSPYARTGFVPEHEKMHDWMTAIDFVTTFARLNGMTREEARLEAERVLTFVELADVMQKQIGRFSKGMRQRVKIAHALVNDPDLIVLDEPLQGCDPLARTSIMNVIRELGRLGRTVLVSSHILSEIERITEQIVILHKGRLLAIGNLHAIRDLLDQHPHKIAIRCEQPKRLAKDLIDIDEVTTVSIPAKDELIVETKHFGVVHNLLPSIIVKNNHHVWEIDNPDDNLQSILEYLTGGLP